MAATGFSMKEVILARRPSGAPVPQDFSVREHELPDCGDGEVTISTQYISIDPYVRCLLDEASPYGETLALGERITGDALSIVVRSACSAMPVGSMVVGRTGWATLSNVKSGALRNVEPWIKNLPTVLSSLGGTGLTAFVGVTEIANPKLGEIALVSGASGGVGILAIQLLRAAGCQVIALAGGSSKTQHLRSELGFNHVIDYKETASLTDAIRQWAPKGIDIYFDNVGGRLSEEVYRNLAVGSRVVLCGEVSQYNSPGKEFNPRLLGPLMAQRASVSAFLVSDYRSNFEEYRKRIQRLLDERKLTDVHDIVDGIESAPIALIGMLRGDNRGKRMVKVTGT
ncbi:MAG: NADP-dependent oxidoreductase [Hyphomicrobiales bacterium]